MTTQQDPSTVKRTVKKKKRKHDWSYYVIIVSLIVLLIPAIFFGYHIITASIQTGHPIFGNRFSSDLSQKIEENQIKTLSSNIQSIDNIESVEVNLISATLRININVNDDLSKDSYPQLAENIVETLESVIPQETYFTATDSDKMYDYEINIYNTLQPSENTPLIFYVSSKSSSLQERKERFISESSNPDFVQYLIDSQTVTDDSEGAPSKEPSTDN